MQNFSGKVVANAENKETSKNEKHSQLPSGVRNLMAGFEVTTEVITTASPIVMKLHGGRG